MPQKHYFLKKDYITDHDKNNNKTARVHCESGLSWIICLIIKNLKNFFNTIHHKALLITSVMGLYCFYPSLV